MFGEIKRANLLKHFRRESFVWKKIKRFKHHPTTIQTPFLKLLKVQRIKEKGRTYRWSKIKISRDKTFSVSISSLEPEMTCQEAVI